jgi:hypothetical protein
MMFKYLETECHESGFLTVFYDSVHLLSKRNVSIACHYNIFPSLFIIITTFQIFYFVITDRNYVFIFNFKIIQIVFGMFPI